MPQKSAETLMLPQKIEDEPIANDSQNTKPSFWNMLLDKKQKIQKVLKDISYP
jgi:hypothetical protein